MELTPRRHELLSVYLFGLATLFLYVGYLSQSFLSESVIHSIHERDHSQISQFAGYYGAAFHYSAFAVVSLLTPSLQHYVTTKWILVISGSLFASFYVGFYSLNAYYFYFSQAVMGVAFAFYNNGEGAYLSEHSSRRTIESNTGIETAVGHFSMFCGGFALLALFALFPPTTSSNFISFSTDQIRYIYGTLFAFNLVAILVFSLLPTKQYDSIASKSIAPVPAIKDQFKLLINTIRAPNMMILMPYFLYMGFAVSFLMSIYPTTLSFTAFFSDDVSIIAIYSISMGLAEAIGGLFIRPLVKKAKQYGMILTVGTNFLVYCVVITLVYLSVPHEAPIRPTNEPPLLLTPSRLLVFVIGFLIGLTDFCMTMARAVICQVAVPEARMQVFSLSKLYQSASSVIALLLTPYMNVTVWVSVLSIFLIIGTVCYGVVARQTQQNNQHTIQPSSERDLEIEKS